MSTQNDDDIGGGGGGVGEGRKSGDKATNLVW